MPEYFYCWSGPILALMQLSVFFIEFFIVKCQQMNNTNDSDNNKTWMENKLSKDFEKPVYWFLKNLEQMSYVECMET